MTAGGFDGVERRGLMFVLSSPSGAGKTTLSRMLIERMPGLKMSVSATTRPMRPGEVDGRDYFFVDKPGSRRWSQQGELLEWATVFDNRYGTPRAPVEAALSAGQDVLFDIDWQGTQQLRERPAPTSSACSSCRPRRPIWRSGCTPARRIPTRSSAAA